MQHYVLVTTEHRGVFYGRLEGEPTKEKVTLTEARNVVHWSADTRGFLGLASKGPTSGCRVGPIVPRITLWDITSVTECSEESRAAWEDAPWR